MISQYPTILQQADVVVFWPPILQPLLPSASFLPSQMFCYKHAQTHTILCSRLPLYLYQMTIFGQHMPAETIEAPEEDIGVNFETLRIRNSAKKHIIKIPRI